MVYLSKAAEWSKKQDHLFLFTLWLVLFFLPGYVLGLQFTKFGFIINLLWYDLIFYGWVRVKQRLGEDE